MRTGVLFCLACSCLSFAMGQMLPGTDAKGLNTYAEAVLIGDTLPGDTLKKSQAHLRGRSKGNGYYTDNDSCRSDEC